MRKKIEKWARLATYGIAFLLVCDFVAYVLSERADWEYRCGYVAGANAAPASACPHSMPLYRVAWLNGWQDGQTQLPAVTIFERIAPRRFSVSR